MTEPVWVVRIVIDAVHLDQLREHGGLPGIRDENALDFLGLNGWDLDAPEAEVVQTLLAVADHRCSEAELADWLRAHMVTL